MNIFLNLRWYSRFLLLLSFFVCTQAVSDINSVLIDRESSPSKIIVLGSGLNNAEFELAGILIPSSCIANISDTEQHILFCAETASAVPGSGSYNLLINSVEIFSIYAEKGIVSLPPPPSDSYTCPCTPAWEAQIPESSLAFCLWGVDGTQEWIATQSWLDGSGRQDVLSAAFDPNNIYFDPGNVGTSISFCSIYDGSTYTTAEPVVNQEQYDDCYYKMLRDICL